MTEDDIVAQTAAKAAKIVESVLEHAKACTEVDLSNIQQKAAEIQGPAELATEFVIDPIPRKDGNNESPLWRR